MPDLVRSVTSTDQHAYQGSVHVTYACVRMRTHAYACKTGLSSEEDGRIGVICTACTHHDVNDAVCGRDVSVV